MSKGVNPQTNPMAKTGITNPVHVGEWVYPCGTSLDSFGADTKVKRGYRGYRAYGGCMEGGGSSDVYPD